jgi:N utilization substance protein B
LGAVQALYQIELGGGAADETIAEFAAYRLGREFEGERYGKADKEWFADVVRGVHARLAEIDERLTAALGDPAKLGRTEALLRATLRAGCYEMLARPDVPARVVIDEYVNVTHAFFAGAEPALINGVLDRLARMLRPNELAADAPAPNAGKTGRQPSHG